MAFLNSLDSSTYYQSPSYVKYLHFINSIPDGIVTDWTPSAFNREEEVLPTLRPPELLVGDDPNIDLRISIVTTINLTDSPMKVELGGGVWPLSTWQGILLFLIKGLILGTVIITSVLGNLLVIVSVARYHKLRVLTNYFVVSMAFADMLVALMVMVFNASVQLSGKWIFGALMCDIWNSMDVYFSTVSILHLCCISIDRYLAIVQPLDYPLRMTRRTVACMLAVAWISPVFISVLPIFLGWYTTQDQLVLMASNPGVCNFKVNLVYALVSSSMSFWIPGIIMLVMYYRIYREADRQEMMVFRSTVAALLLNKHLHINGLTKGSVKITDNSNVSKNGLSCAEDPISKPEPLVENIRPVGPGGDLPSEESTPSPSPLGTPQTKRLRRGGKRRFMGVGIRKSSGEGKEVNVGLEAGAVKEDPGKGGGGGKQEGMIIKEEEVKKKQSPLNKMKRERKAAKTLGIIVSVFLLCWLPFFTWYLVSSLCGDSCESPELLVAVLFWIGYFNSTLNPIIYAYFNRDFRKAFRKTLKHYYSVCGCKRLTKLCKKCCKCGSDCNTCVACKTALKCALICPRILREDTPSSEVPPRSGISSDYVHIEMMRIDREDDLDPE